MSEEGLPKGWRASEWWQEKASALLGPGDVTTALASAALASESVSAALVEKAPDEEVALRLALMLVYIMAAGHHLQHDLGVMMSVVCNRIEQGRDPLAPDWEKELPKKKGSAPEPAKEEVAREHVEEVSAHEIWVNFNADEWSTIERFDGDKNLVAGEMAYGIWHKEAPDMDAWAGHRRTVFKKGVVVLGAPLTKTLSLRLAESEMPGGMFYVLAGVDEKKKRVRLFGWASADEITNAKITEVGQRRVKCRSIPASRMHEIRRSE